MNKLGMVLGAAAIVTLAGCKDPDYKYENASSAQDEVKVVETEKNLDVKPVEVKPVEIKEAPVEKPLVVADLTKPTVETKPAAAAKPVETETTTYVVQSGDSLSKISKKSNVTLSALRRANPSLKGDRIRIGQKLVIPGRVVIGDQKVTAAASAKKATVAVASGSVYVVKSGDTLGGIAVAHGVSVRQLKEVNGLKKDSIRVGQKLKMPAKTVVKSADRKAVSKKDAAAKKVEKKVTAVAEAPAAAPTTQKASEAPAAAPVTEPAPAADTAPVAVEPAAVPAPAPAAEPAPAASQTATYVVQEGDDMTGISIRWGVSAAAIRELNNLSDNDQLKPGQVIKLPADAQQ